MVGFNYTEDCSLYSFTEIPNHVESDIIFSPVSGVEGQQSESR